MVKDFIIAINGINKQQAVSEIYFSFTRKIRYARIHLNELKEMETKLLIYNTVDRDKLFEFLDPLRDDLYKNLMPCVVNIKGAIECLKMCFAINDADQSYINYMGWKKTLSKIKNDLNIPMGQLDDFEEKIINLRNFLVHFGDPSFQFNIKTFKIMVPNYTKIHPKLTVPTAENGFQEIVVLLEIMLKKMEELSDQLINKRYFYKLQKYPSFGQDWIIRDATNNDL